MIEFAVILEQAIIIFNPQEDVYKRQAVLRLRPDADAEGSLENLKRSGSAVL